MSLNPIYLQGVLVLAFVLDIVLGDPGYRMHPARVMGGMTRISEKVLRRLGLHGRGGGVLLAVLVILSVILAYMAARYVFEILYPYSVLALDTFVCYSCLALKDLVHHSRPVLRALEAGRLKEAGEAVALVVGRDVSGLDAQGVCRAAVETLAENFVDGFLSPLFWYTAGGITGFCLGYESLPWALVFMLTFKAASTLDSMVGYRSGDYLKFGWAGARLDDLMNFIPARISIPVLFLGSMFAGLRPFEGVRTALRDRLKHDSPNAAHAESFAAGALGVRLGGPLMYGGRVKEKEWLGREYRDPGPEDIRKAIRLVYFSAWTATGASLAVLALTYFNN